MQRALLEALMLSVLGSWIVLRRLAFFTHGVGTAAFPGLVVAGPWGVAPQVAALGAGLLYAGSVERLTRTRRVATDAATGLLLVGFLALGVVLASDVFESPAGIDRLLFGSLIALEPRDLWLTGGAVALALALQAALGRTWLAGGFEPGSARALGLRATAADRALLDRPGLRQLLAAADAGPLVRPVLSRARGLHDAWVGALSGLVSLQNAFRRDRSCAECTDPCPAGDDLPCARRIERAAATAARFGDEDLPRFAADVLAPLAERVLREQRATALRIRTVAGGPGGGLLPGCSPRRRLDLLDRRIGATKALLTRGVRCFDTWGDAVLGTGDLWRLAAQAVPVCAGAATLSVHTTRRAG
jgi:hypothetical protein